MTSTESESREDAEVWALLQSDIFKAAEWEEAYIAIVKLVEERERAAEDVLARELNAEKALETLRWYRSMR